MMIASWWKFPIFMLHLALTFEVNASPFIFISSHQPKCLEVDSDAGMSLHFHYYTPNLKAVDAARAPRERWNDPAHHHMPEKIHSGMHNIQENIQHHVKMATGLTDENNPLTHRWEHTVKRMKYSHNIVEEESVSNLSLSITSGQSDQPQTGMSAKTHRHVITDKTGTIQFDVHEPSTVKFCLHCFTCSHTSPLMISTQINQVPMTVLEDVKHKRGKVQTLTHAVMDAREKVRDVKESDPNKTVEVDKAKQEFNLHQIHGKNHLGYLKHEIKGMIMHLEMEMRKSETIKHMENTMYRDGVRFQKSSKFYPTMKILVLIITTTMQARALVAYLKKLHII